MADRTNPVSIGPDASKASEIRQLYKDMGDGTHALVVATKALDASGGGAAGKDRELVVTTYIVKTAFTGSSVGDTITLTRILDVTDAPTTVAVLWRNETKNTDLASAPSIANLNLAGMPGLTDAQLRATPLPVAGSAGENHIGSVGGHTIRANANFARPADTVGYAIGDLIANTVAPGTVVPMEFVIGRDLNSRGGMVRRARLRKTGAGTGTFRLHLYAVAPTVDGASGDNLAWKTNQANSYVGSIDITCDKVFNDGAAGNGVPTVGGEINFTSDKYYGLLEARSGYVPVSGETFTVTLETLQN